MSRACATCEFWVRRSETVGQCRFNPPAQVFDVRNSIITNWPDSRADDWCGRHARRVSTAQVAAAPEAAWADEF